MKALTEATKEFLPYKYNRKDLHPERSYLFAYDSVTAVTPDGKIFIIGG